jgi:hypothetical protein
MKTRRGGGMIFWGVASTTTMAAYLASSVGFVTAVGHATHDNAQQPQQILPHPRLRLTPFALATMRAKIESDPLAATVAAQLRDYGATLLNSPVVNCSLAGVEHSLLSQARSVLDRTYTLGMLYRLDGNASWAQRAVQEMLHVTAHPTCLSWNPSHFLDTAEMMHAVAIGYDWLYSTPVLSVADRTTIAHGLATRGLQITAEHWKDWFFTATINWNEVCNGGAIAASLALLDSPVRAHQALAAAVLKNATANIRLSEMSSYGPDGAWSEGSTYWGYATKYALAAIQMLTTATGNDTGLGASPGFDRTGMWRIHNTGPLDDSYNWGDSDADGGDEFLVDFFGLASQPVAPMRAVTAYWGRSVFNRTLRCQEAGCALALLDWPSPSLGSVNDLENQPTCKSFRFSDSGWDNKTALGYFRSDWRQSKCADWNRAARPGFTCKPRSAQDQPVWLGFKAGNGQANHNDLDGGSFVFDMAGHRWAVDLGSDSYGLPSYFDKSAAHGKRYSYYRKSTRGHNTLTFNGVDEHPGWCAQDDHAVSEITEFNCSADAPHGLIDLTPAYAKGGGPNPPTPATERVVRGFSIVQNFSRIIIRDEWIAAGADNVTWAMHFFGPSTRKYSTETTVKLSADNRVAILCSTSGATITASIDEPTSAQFEVVTPVIKTGSTNPTGAHPVDNLRKLIVVLDPKHDAGLTVSFATPSTPPSPPVRPLSEWGTFGALRGTQQQLKTDDDDDDDTITPWHPSAQCQAEANAFCNNGTVQKLKGDSCFHYIAKSTRKCEGPMLARKSLASGHFAHPEWRCYSPGVLTPNHTSYNSSNVDHNCYCSLDSEIRAVLADCGDPDPSLPPRPPPPPPPPAPGGVAVYSSGSEGYHTFRIPAVVSHPLDHRRLLCFCEGRKFSSEDHDWNDIVVKTSLDAGTHWSPLRLVWSESTIKKHVTIGNPSPIALHTQPGTVILVGCRNNAQVFVMKSTDFGQTFGKPQYIPQANYAKWPFVATGPPQGLQLPNGRLIVASDHSTRVGCSGNVSSHVMYSDSDGADTSTWKLSANFVRSGNECQIATLSNSTIGHRDGTLVMNSRWRTDEFVKTPPGRLVSYSTDSGSSWTTGVTAKVGARTAYAGDSCEGSTISAGPTATPMLLFSTPYHRSERANMTVFSSGNAGLTWDVLEHIDAGPSAYSALVALNDTHVGLIYESGSYEFLTFRTVELQAHMWVHA